MVTKEMSANIAQVKKRRITRERMERIIDVTFDIFDFILTFALNAFAVCFLIFLFCIMGMIEHPETEFTSRFFTSIMQGLGVYFIVLYLVLSTKNNKKNKK